MITISTQTALYFLSGCGVVIWYCVRSLIKNLNELKKLIENNVSRETFNEFKNTFNSALQDITEIRVVQAKHDEKLEHLEKSIGDITQKLRN